VEELASILWCGVASIPIKHLGLPLGAKYKDSNIWYSIIEKMENRLVGWKRLCLSKGWRLTLINSNLSNLPTCFFIFLPYSCGSGQSFGQTSEGFSLG
jgi:hypothetical protein